MGGYVRGSTLWNPDWQENSKQAAGPFEKHCTNLKWRESLLLSEIKGKGRIWPFAASGLVLANLAFSGIPLLAGFPPHQAIWEGLASTSLSLVIWVSIGNIGLFFSAIRVLLAFTSASEGTRWESRETGMQRILLAIGFLAMLLLGIFPQWVMPLWEKLPVIFTHLGQ